MTEKNARTFRIVGMLLMAACAILVLGPKALFAAPVVFGAISLEDAHLTFQRTFQDSRGVPTAEVLRCFKKVHAEHLKNIQLQLVNFSGLSSADGVIADAACKLYLIAAKKPSGSTTASWLKGSNHATVAAAAADLGLPFAATDTGWHTYFDPQGTVLGTGLTLGAHTTVSGNTKSNAADAPTGFAIIGAP